MVHCVIFPPYLSIISRGHFYFHGKNVGFSPVGFAVNFHGNNFFCTGCDLVSTGSKPIFLTGYKKFFAGKKKHWEVQQEFFILR